MAAMDDDLVPLTIGPPEHIGNARFKHDTIRWRLDPVGVRVWYRKSDLDLHDKADGPTGSPMMRTMAGEEYLVVPDTWINYPVTQDLTLHVEALEPSMTLGDQSVTYKLNATSQWQVPGSQDLVDYEVNLTNEVLITSVTASLGVGGLISLDAESTAWGLTVALDPDSEVDLKIALADQSVELISRRDGAELTREQIDFANADGVAIDLGTATDTLFEAEAHLFGATVRALPYLTTPGSPHTFTFEPPTTSLVADGVSTTTVRVTAHDQFGHLVPDGTPISATVVDSAAAVVAEHSSTEFIDGVADIVVRGPLTVPPQRALVIEVASAPSIGEITVPVVQVSGTMGASAATLDIHTGDTATLSLATNAADGTPVFWTIDNGQTRTAESVTLGGVATLEVSASDNGSGLSRVGPCRLTATVADTLFHLQIDFVHSGPVSLGLDRQIIVGDESQDGIASVPINQFDPLPGYPSAVSPTTHQVPYTTVATVSVAGDSEGLYAVELVDPANHAWIVELIGLSGDGLLSLDSTGAGQFSLQSRGQLPAGSIALVPVRVSRVTPLGFDPEEEIVTIVVVPKDSFAIAQDVALSFFGGDPETGYGIAAGVTGGVLVVGDVGAITKNMYRVAGFSEKEPSKFEVAMSGLGLATSTIPQLDAVVALVRTIAGALGDARLVRLLFTMVQDLVTSPANIPRAANFTESLATHMDLRVADLVFSSQEVIDDGIRTVERLSAAPIGNRTSTVFSRINSLVDNAAAGGHLAGRRVIEVLGHPNLSQKCIDELTALDDIALGEALGNIARATTPEAGGLSAAQLVRLLSKDSDVLYTQGFGRREMLQAVGLLGARAAGDPDKMRGLATIVNKLIPASVPNFIRGLRYELVVAKRLYDLDDLGTPEVIQRFVSAAETGTTKTDIDVIFKHEFTGRLTFVQAKTSANAAAKNPGAWVAKVRAYAKSQGLALDQYQIMYVMPDPENLVDEILDQFVSLNVIVRNPGISNP